jgi:hydrogenase expression/formation protein HypD
MARVFDVGPASWRGLGTIPDSGLSINEEYAAFDAEKRFPVDPGETIEPKGCHCGEVIRGVMTPGACPLFRKSCTPMSPVGPCMVSTEGTCAAYYLYEKGK